MANMTGEILVRKVIPLKGRPFWTKQNPLSNNWLHITPRTAQLLIHYGAIHVDDYKVQPLSPRAITIQL
jgi:hypothetical protein